MASQNDYNILMALITRNDSLKGVAPSKGTTKQEIQEATGMSITKISNTLKLFIEQGFVEYGLNVGRAKSFIVTDEGFREMRRVYPKPKKKNNNNTNNNK